MPPHRHQCRSGPARVPFQERTARTAQRVKVRRGERGVPLGMPAGTHYATEKALATVMGPRDEAWLEARWADPETRVLVVAGTRVRPVDGRIPWLAPAEASYAGRRVLLGERDGRTWFALLVERDDAPGDRAELSAELGRRRGHDRLPGLVDHWRPGAGEGDRRT